MKMSKDDFLKMVAGELDGTTAFMMGKLKIKKLYGRGDEVAVSSEVTDISRDCVSTVQKIEKGGPGRSGPPFLHSSWALFGRRRDLVSSKFLIHKQIS